MPKLLMMKKQGSLHPITEVDWDEFDNVPFDKPVFVTVRMSRNPEHLKKYWAVASTVADHCDAFDNKEDADWWARMSSPLMRKELTFKDGTTAWRPLSIALDKMDQGKFSLFYESAIKAWAELIGADPEDLIRIGKEAGK